MNRHTIFAVLVLAHFAAVPLAAQDGYRTPAPELARLVDAPRTPDVRLDPDRTTLLLLEVPGAPSIAEVAEPELRLAGLRINPRNDGPSRGRSYSGMALRPLDGGGERTVRGLPDDPRIRNVEWAPDGRRVAFTLDRPERIELWVLDVETARARRLTDRAVSDVFRSSPVEWAAAGRSLIVRTVPVDRGPPPEEPRVPEGPVVQENVGRQAPARTYQDLLEDAHDEELFEYHATAQLARVGLDGTVTELGEPGVVTRAAPSPDGRMILIESVHRPFSYLVPYYRFPRRIEVLDTDGERVAEIADLPLQEEVPTAFASVPTGVRSVAWRPDADATLYWVEALDGGDARVETEERDRVFTLEAPFTGEPAPLATLPLRYAGAVWAGDGTALVSERWFADRTARTYVVDADRPGERRVLFDYSYEDRYADPGDPLTRPTERGTRVLLTADDGGSIFLTGRGASPQGDRPFLRRLDLATGETEELFRSEAPWFEAPVALLDPGEGVALTVRESVDEPPNFYVRDLDDGDLTAVTDFPHPYPELRDVRKELITYERADGVPLTATLHLPPGYEPARDGPLPALVWAYPVEFKSADAAGQVTDSPHRFNRISYWGPVPFVTQGYAVLDAAAMPVVGEGEEEPNDTFREQLVMNARAVVEEGARRGVVDPERVAIGGHSYGAFMTANLLAHSDVFRAGIARSGAYNRTLTPFGFQREERLFWEAPEIYYQMSPFMHVDEIDEPVLLIHGRADNNSGTYPMQSERFYSALKGLGATARLVMLPHESHGYRARESLLHMLWEEHRWLETYVKDAPPREVERAAESGARPDR